MLTKTKNLKEAYAELKADLLEELNLVDPRIIRPATEVLECIKPIKKTIKNRENKRVDYESYLDRVDKKRRQKRSEKEEAGLLKLEADMGKAADVCTSTTTYPLQISLTSIGFSLRRRSST